jgi:hypothetical protein
VADHLAVVFGDEGQAGVAPCSQGIAQAGVVVSTEGEAVDVADGVVVSDGFGAEQGGRMAVGRCRVSNE